MVKNFAVKIMGMAVCCVMAFSGVNVKKSSSGAVLKGLKENTKYYICVRTFKTVDGGTVYSDWSKKYVVRTKA